MFLRGYHLHCCKSTTLNVFTNVLSMKITSKVTEKLMEATRKFDERLNPTEVDVKNCAAENPEPVTTIHHGRFLRDINEAITWEMYISYPYILWDPLTHYKSLYANNKLMCLLCSEDGASLNVLFRTGEWYNGWLARLSPRIIFVNTKFRPAILLS